jgi:hypothetical protein
LVVEKQAEGYKIRKWNDPMQIENSFEIIPKIPKKLQEDLEASKILVTLFFTQNTNPNIIKTSNKQQRGALLLLKNSNSK